MRERERERVDVCWGALICAARSGSMSAQALSSDKERESISRQWARQRGTDWCFSMDAARPHKPGQLIPSANRMGGPRKASSSFDGS